MGPHTGSTDWSLPMQGRADLNGTVLLNKLFGSHTTNLSNSLDRTSLRQKLLAGNLANIDTPGFKRRDVDFGIELAKADGVLRPERSLQNRPPIRTENGSIRLDGNSVDLEKEVFAVAETELRYQLLTDMTSRYFRGIRNVIREGR